MDHAKKMLLVDPARLTSIVGTAPSAIVPESAPTTAETRDHLRTLYRPSMVDKQLSKLDADIVDTLNSNLPDDEKAKRYAMSLRAYRYYEPKTLPFDRYGARARQRDEDEDDDDDLLQSTPLPLRRKAKRLLKSVKPYARWNDDGEIVYRNELVPHSDVGELIASALDSSTTKKTRPKGYEAFADALKRARTPKEFINNENLWSYLNPKSSKTIKKRQWVHY